MMSSPAVKEDAPPTVMSAVSSVSVMSPVVAVTESVPEAEMTFRSISFASTSVTSLASTFTAPPKSLVATSSVTDWPVAVMVVVPVTTVAPLSVTAPVETRSKLVAEIPARSIPLVSETFSAPASTT